MEDLVVVGFWLISVFWVMLLVSIWGNVRLWVRANLWRESCGLVKSEKITQNALKTIAKQEIGIENKSKIGFGFNLRKQ